MPTGGVKVEKKHKFAYNCSSLFKSVYQMFIYCLEMLSELTCSVATSVVSEKLLQDFEDFSTVFIPCTLNIVAFMFFRQHKDIFMEVNVKV